MTDARMFRPDPGARFLRGLVGLVSPTADLYLANPCADWLAAGQIVQLAPTVFKAGETLIVVRHALGLDAPVAFRKLIYVMDDDWRGGLANRHLPLSFRANSF